MQVLTATNLRANLFKVLDRVQQSFFAFVNHKGRKFVILPYDTYERIKNNQGEKKHGGDLAPLGKGKILAPLGDAADRALRKHIKLP